MMRRFLSLVVIIVFAASTIRIYPQQTAPKGKLEVIAVKGSIVFKGSELKRGDRIKFNPDKSVMDQLIFSKETDWIKLMEIDSKKLSTYYKQKKYSCTNCLFTRGVFPVFELRVDPYDYFSRKLIFLFDADTILLLNSSINFNPNNVSAFQILINNKIYNRVVGSYDTIILSHDNLFGFAREEQILWPSFQTDSISLLYIDNLTDIKTSPAVPYFHIKFIEDAIPFFKNMEMSTEEIYNELIENYIDLKYLTARKGFKNPEETKKWIRAYIEAYLNNLQ